ncbi:hypothetical protein PDG61_16295 [Mycolicibacterium sp. BiH015]|uniref:hypothetical protein n=1 Tax=Mycolicibacterium sp. BiH015 TaxID=3018808 RepID=UPI0022E902BC|nr:hypothetical protein [Mycolicibacterium sp. BiH015]MDA2892482.1 hypothetical protein [Mycolicibacterium sp. BiH015]
MPSIRTVTRRGLSKRVSVGAMIEFVLWLLIPYVTVGLVWAFFHADEVRRLEDVLAGAIPAGGGMAAYLLVAALWPLHVLIPSVCVT